MIEFIEMMGPTTVAIGALMVIICLIVAILMCLSVYDDWVYDKRQREIDELRKG